MLLNTFTFKNLRGTPKHNNRCEIGTPVRKDHSLWAGYVVIEPPVPSVIVKLRDVSFAALTLGPAEQQTDTLLLIHPPPVPAAQHLHIYTQQLTAVLRRGDVICH